MDDAGYENPAYTHGTVAMDDAAHENSAYTQ